MELGAMGVTAALGALAYGFITLAKAEEERRKSLDDHIESMVNLNDELERAETLASGLGSAQIAVDIAYAELEATRAFAEESAVEYKRLRTLGIQQGRLQEGLKEAGRRAIHFKREAAEAEVRMEIAAAKRDAGVLARKKQTIAAEEKAEEARLKRLKDRLKREARVRAAAAERLRTQAIRKRYDSFIAEYEKDRARQARSLAAFKRDWKKIADEEVRLQEAHMWRLYNLREKEEKRKTKQEKDAAKDRGDIKQEEMSKALEWASFGADAVTGILMDAANAQEGHIMEAISMRLKGMALEATGLALFETAKGFAMLFVNPNEATGHFIAAAQFAAFAALYAGGHVATGGHTAISKDEDVQGRMDRQGGRGESPWGGEKRETTIIITLGGREVGRAIHEELEGYKDRLHPNRGNAVVGYR